MVIMAMFEWEMREHLRLWTYETFDKKTMLVVSCYLKMSDIYQNIRLNLISTGKLDDDGYSN